jgi:hypothetical protein
MANREQTVGEGRMVGKVSAKTAPILARTAPAAPEIDFVPATTSGIQENALQRG